MSKAWRLILILGLVLSIGMFFVNRIEAQSVQYGKLTGKVLLSAGDPIAGVAVEITSDALIEGKRTTVSSSNGSYVFLNLPVGKYKIKAILQSFKTFTQARINVSAGKVTTINVMMEEGKIVETVEVTASAPVLDVRTSTIDSRLNNELLQKLPTGRDAFYDLSLTTPGMFAVGRDASWLPSPTAYGGSTNENSFLVDGVNTTNPRGSAWGSMVHVNYNAVEEVRVLSLGTKAEYGNFSGVAIDVLTKSGGNKIRGSVGFYSMVGSPKNNVLGTGELSGSDFLYVQEGDAIFHQDKEDQELSLTFGGPLIKNKVWFFSAFNHTNKHVQEPSFAPTKDFRGSNYDLKLTAQPYLNHNVSLAYHYEDNRNDGTSWGNLMWDPSMRYSTNNITHMISAQWFYNVTSTTTLAAKYLGFWSDDDPVIPKDAPDNPGYVNWWKFIPKDMAVNGAMREIEAQNARRTTVQADLSHYAENFLGEHDMKFGVQYTSGRGDWFGGYFHGYKNQAYPQPWTTSLQELQSSSPDGYPMYVDRFYRNPFLTVRKVNALGIFFDDQWTIGDRLTLNLGLRYDKTISKFGEGKVFESIADPFSNRVEDLAVLRTRNAGSGNVFDFKTFSPRIGLTYMLTSDGKTVFRVGYGRYYLPIGVESLGKNGPDADPVTRITSYYNVPWAGLDTDGDGEIYGWDVAEATRRLHNLQPYGSNTANLDYSWEPKPNKDLTNQHTDQFTVSFEREFFDDFSISATYIHRETRNMIMRWPINEVTGEEWEYQRVNFQTVEGETLSLYSIVPEDYNGDGVINPADVQWVRDHDDFEWRNLKEFDGKTARRLYQGFQVSFNKQYSKGWQLLASFLYSKTEGLARRSIRQDVNLEGPFMLENPWVGDVNQLVNNMEGPLPYTPKFEAKVSGSYRVPKINVDLGLRLRYSTGRAAWPIQPVPLQESWMGSMDPNLVISALGGAFLVSNDVKDPYYYEPQTILDLHLERQFELGKGRSIRLMLDWYNMFNESSPTNAWWKDGAFGRVYMLTYPSSKIRLGAVFNF